jgi:dCTP deaminase
MSFWSSETLKQRIPADGLIAPYEVARIKHAAYEMSLGNEAYVTSSPSKKKFSLWPGDHVEIPSGQFALLHTAEVIQVPANAIAFISIKAKIKLKGLVNVSGFHVDPGFNGQLVFSVYNAGSRSVRIGCGEPVFLIWFSDLTGPTSDVYSGGYAGQRGIKPQAVMEIDGDIASPAVLTERIRELEATAKVHTNLLWSCLIVLLLGILTLIIQNNTGHIQ